jgi:NAD(P)-dependent dehydrogenase (short-subunit alcohol dehydrogenase family)
MNTTTPNPVVVAIGSSSGVASQILPILKNRYEVIKFSMSGSDRTSVRYATLDDIKLSLASFIQSRRPLYVIDFRVKKFDCLISNKNIDDFRAELEVNVVQRLALIQLFVDPMLRAKRGRFVFFGSELIEFGVPGTVSYTVAKMSDRGMASVLNAELSRFNITAKCIPIGYMRAGLFNALTEGTKAFTEREVSETAPLGLVNEISAFLDDNKY